MKKFKVMTLIMIIAVVLFGGVLNASAATTLPDEVVSDKLREVEYIENFPVIVKATNNGSYYVYCLNMSATYASGVTFSKTDYVDDGFIYILNHRPQTSNKDRDFYITQMAVWYYDDYINNNNYNLVKEVKQYILAHRNEEGVSKEIYNLYYAARSYAQETGSIKVDAPETATFKKVGNYYESSVIKVEALNIDGKLKYSLENAPEGSLIEEVEGGIIVKIPADTVTPGKQLKVTLNIEGDYKQYKAYYYFYNTNYQRVLFQDPIEITEKAKTSAGLSVDVPKEIPEINVCKTEPNKVDSVEGSTYEIQDENGKVIETWVATKEAHKIQLSAGKYVLITKAVKAGYKVAAPVYFQVDSEGNLYVKNDNGEYIKTTDIYCANDLKDVVSIIKKDSSNNNNLSGAILIIKDANDNVISEFTSTDGIYQIELNAGYYSLSEKAAPSGYVLSNEVLYFYLKEDGTLQVKNDKGNYVDSAMLVFYNTPEKKIEVVVPATGDSRTLMIVSGIAIIVGGVYCAKKSIKEC